MTRFNLSRLRGAMVALVAAAAMMGMVETSVASAQTFGRNKVQYDRFDFRIQPTPHFDIYFYPAESLATADAARMAERWYQRQTTLLKHEFTGNPIIFYANSPDFQQSNVVEGSIGVGTGGITEGMRERVIMPFTGIYADNDHVLGHEIVHVFQYRIAQSMPSGLRSISQIPLWLIEGMAEYISLGVDDANTAMWLRDAALRNDLPTIRQLTTDGRYFPYRYGQALWAFIGGTWGDAMVNQLFRAALREGWERSLQSQLKMSADSLSALWHSAIRRQYASELTRTSPDALGRLVVRARERGEQNVAPALSPDGRFVSFFSSRNLFGIELYVADAATGRIVRQLTSVTSDPHFDALSFISSAGSWSSDNERLAVVTYAQGDNEIDIYNARTGRLERRIRPPGIPAMADPAWSPDGKRIAFAGIVGGISDLYIYDLETNAVERLTNDREAQLQPTWSPDGRTIAFTTDADPLTRFDVLNFEPLRLATIDVATRAVRLLPKFAFGKAINPQYSMDGQSLYFIADQDGISDIYRLALASGSFARVTRTATGVSGITGSSPALSIARGTGDLVFSVFSGGGFSLRSLSAAEAVGEPVRMLATRPTAGLLPPATSSPAANYIEQALDRPQLGLPARLEQDTRAYRSRLSLQSIGNVSGGVVLGGGYGTGVAGGVALGFSDMLGNNVLQTVVNANGTFKDVGAQALYLNRSRRLNWGITASHVPFASAFAQFRDTTVTSGGQQFPATIVAQFLQREYFQEAQGIMQYPLSTTRRLEFGLGGQRISYGLEVDSLVVVGNQVVGQRTVTLPGPEAINLATGSAAFVGDYSFFGFTSPIAGGRYRFEVSPYAGTLNFTTAYADYRRYFFMRPVSFAVRGLHFGRYGGDAEGRISDLYMGQPTLIRGYDATTFRNSECTGGSNPNSCPQLSRLLGSRLAVANFELRVPLLGTEQLGLINFPYIPVEVAPFFDAGVAWRSDDTPDFRFDRNTADRVPVFSTGVATRVNLFGYAVVEVFYVKPFQRPERGNYWGFQLAPGW